MPQVIFDYYYILKFSSSLIHNILWLHYLSYH